MCIRDTFPSEVGPGLAVFHPKGGTMRRVMEEYSRKRHEVSGYDFVYSPHITKSELFEISGHLDWFAESMYPPMELDGGTTYYLKPMNCPFPVSYTHLDDDDARRRVAEMVDHVSGLRAVIAGSMSLASPIEAFTAVCISINIRHKAHSYVKMAGL